jgi:ATP-dependent RNA helicase DDX52/ROK1
MDVFKLLASGARFTDKRNKEIKNLFQGKAPAPVVAKEKVSDSDDESEVKKDRGFDFSREDEVNGFRNRLRIRVKGASVVNPCPTFQEMKIDGALKTSLLRNIEASKWKEPTPIQMQSIPVLLANRDILAAAPTGSGKTASYVIPTLSKLSKSSSKSGSGVRALLLSPTKELADQIFREVQRLSEGRKIKSCVLKKKLMKMAEDHGRKVFQKYDLLIATPLRLLTLVRSNSIDLSQVEIVVLDEADRLLDLQSSPRERNQQPPSDEEDEEEDDEDEEDEEANPDKELSKRERSAFLSQVDEILAQCPATGVQRALFSATLGSFVKELAATFLRDPVEVTIGAENTGASTIKQRLVFVGREDGKLLAMRQLIQEGLKPPVLVFMQSIDRAKDLFKELIYDGINVDVMHAGRSAHQREDIMRRFRIGDIWVLICTDLMARGIDFQGVQMVVNYDLPVSAVNYIHRIGRTGRAGRTGEAVTFFTEEDMPRIRPIANVIKLSGCEVPDWMLQIKAVRLSFIYYVLRWSYRVCPSFFLSFFCR